MEDNPLVSPLTDAAGEFPSADDIARELQQFLSHHGENRGGDDGIDGEGNFPDVSGGKK
jgi:hypothetical protein